MLGAALWPAFVQISDRDRECALYWLWAAEGLAAGSVTENRRYPAHSLFLPRGVNAGTFIFLGMRVPGVPQPEDDAHTTFTLQREAERAPFPLGEGWDFQVTVQLLSKHLMSGDCGQGLGLVLR